MVCLARYRFIVEHWDNDFWARCHSGGLGFPRRGDAVQWFIFMQILAPNDWFCVRRIVSFRQRGQAASIPILPIVEGER